MFCKNMVEETLIFAIHHSFGQSKLLCLFNYYIYLLPILPQDNFWQLTKLKAINNTNIYLQSILAIRTQSKPSFSPSTLIRFNAS